MRLLPNVRRDVSPLSPDVERMLRGVPRVAAPAGLRSDLLATFDARGASRGARFWARFGVPAVASAAAALVLAAGASLRSPAAESADWVQIHPTAVVSHPPVRVVDVKDASLDALGRAGTLLAAAPMESP